MPAIRTETSRLLVVDFQARLMPAIHEAESVVANARRLIDAATLMGVPVVFTEQNPGGIGRTIEALRVDGAPVVAKTTFDAVAAPGFAAAVPDDGRALVVAGCEAHVCVAQTTLGLLGAGRKVFLVRDALGARRPENKAAAIERLARHGAEVVTTEMVVFEWLGSSDHPRFREALALIK